MSNPLFKILHITKPIDGLEEAFEADRERFDVFFQEEFLGGAGRMIGASKSGYVQTHPENVPIFNANVCAGGEKIWFGDLDLTTDENELRQLAEALGTTVHVLYERDGRFQGRDEKPAIEKAVYSVTASGETSFADHIVRAADGTLQRKPRG